jgi:uncharacterized caspase-like protein
MLHVVAIGIDRYEDPSIMSLHHARDDAEAFGRLFEERIHPEERQVSYLLDEKATQENIKDAIGERLARVVRSSDDVVILYFACHGSPETNQSPDETARYLIAHDTQFKKIYATGIDMERELPRWFNRLSKPDLIVMFLDTCFSGRAGGRTFEGPSLKKARAEERASGLISLKPLDLGEGRIIITACDDDQVARESHKFGHGLFTYALLDVLNAKDNTQDTISISQLYDEVSKLVRKLSRGLQEPVFNGRLNSAQLPLLRQ